MTGLTHRHHDRYGYDQPDAQDAQIGVPNVAKPARELGAWRWHIIAASPVSPGPGKQWHAQDNNPAPERPEQIVRTGHQPFHWLADGGREAEHHGCVNDQAGPDDKPDLPPLRHAAPLPQIAMLAAIWDASRRQANGAYSHA